MRKSLIFFLVFIISVSLSAQKKRMQKRVEKDTIFRDDLTNPLSPSKAAFYSAVLPGLGQAYNKKYWKIPLVYGALGSSSYYYFLNNSDLRQYRNAYKLRLAGKPDEFLGLISNDGLISAQKTLKRNRDLSLFLTLAFYALNIIEANVDAHLQDRPIDNKVSFRPLINYASDINKPVFGIATTIKIN
ncbi:MAG: hypothetical protein HQ471_10620 [Flavobacteriales bacterium]|jgi:hypothetical protein|nr:hypothetical protein [Flavobacteriales bacterium]